MKQAVIIYGAGGFAREVAWLAEEAGYEVLCFVDDDLKNQGKTLNGIPIASLEEAAKKAQIAKMVIAVGNPQVREHLAQKAEAMGLFFGTIIHPNVRMSKWVEIGEGTIITAGNILTTNIRIGKHVHINLDCTVGHDALLDDFTTLAPGVHVSGWVYLGKRVYIGTGAVIINGTSQQPLTIGNDVVVGAGAVVTKPVPAGLTVVGVPAKPLRK